MSIFRWKIILKNLLKYIYIYIYIYKHINIYVICALTRALHILHLF